MYPDTYNVDVARDFLDQLVVLQLKAFNDKVRLPYQEKIINFELDRYKTLILASVVEKEEKQSLSVLNNTKQSNVSLKNLHFFLPVKGIVTNGFDVESGHMATDIVAQPNEPVLATLEGTVTLATWSLTEGYIIIIQHNYNIISIYKHNESLLKKTGDHVTAGEPIAIIGNTGELTTGPHLHFELWYDGSPLNPEDYIAF